MVAQIPSNMKKLTYWIMISSWVFSQAPISGQETNWMSHVGKALVEFQPSDSYERTIASIAQARDRFFKSLTREQKIKSLRSALNSEWRIWSNLPPRPDYAGVLMRDLSPEQIHAFLNLMGESTSAAGFVKIRDIILSDDKLVKPPGVSPTAQMLMGSDYYFIVLFGEPSDESIWGWQLDGHHLGLNVLVQKGDLSIAPSFIGVQPALFDYGPHQKIEPMKSESRLQYKILESLTESQRRSAIVGDRTQGLLAGPGDDEFHIPAEGLAISDMSADQQRWVSLLMQSWISILPDSWANHHMKEFEDSMSKGFFVWKGSESAEPTPGYYRIYTPKYLVEFCHQNLGGDPWNHLHSVFRMPGNDYLGATIAVEK